MRRLLVLATAGTLAALAATAPASAKGPSTASLTGPGIDHALPVKGEGEMGPGTPLGSLVQLGGFFPQVFGQSPDPTTRTRPPATSARVTASLSRAGTDGNSTIVQDVYPYAKPAGDVHARRPALLGRHPHPRRLVRRGSRAEGGPRRGGTARVAAGVSAADRSRGPGRAAGVLAGRPAGLALRRRGSGRSGC